ncbi:MAG TPA: sialidase family protein, partial [Blastocatellia bacterium]|nr:sialidase family protein [Blastocatellia bacterium]
SGNLTLSASPVIPGISYAFDSSSVGAGTAVNLTINVGSDAHPGTYPINVQASGGGLIRSTNFRLTVYGPSIASVPQDLSRSSGFSSIQNGLKTDQSGTVHLVYDDDTAVAAGGGQVLYRKSNDGGVTYSDPVVISTNPGSSGQSTLALDSSGDLLVTYLTLDSATGNTQAFFSRSTDHGGTFSSPAVVSPVSDLAQLPIVAAGKNGIVACYVQVTNSASNLVVATSADGQTFSKAIKVSGPGQIVDLFTTSIGADSQGAVYIAYNTVQKGLEAVEMVEAADGVHFGSPTIVSDPTIEAFQPAMAIDSSGGIYVAFTDLVLAGAQSSQIFLTHSCDHGASFSVPVPVSKTSGNAQLPALGLDANGGVYVAWEDTTGNSQLDVFAARSMDAGVTFDQSRNLSANFGVSAQPAVALDGRGNFIVAWTDDSWEDTEIVSSNVPLLLPPSGPDFELVASQPELTILPSGKGVVSFLIGRTAGFSGSVTVTPPNTSALKLILQPASAATTCTSVSFNFKSKRSLVGTTQLVFTAKDSSGRTRTAMVELVVKSEP